MPRITLASLVDRLTSIDGDRALAQVQLAEALEALELPIQGSYSMSDVLRIAAAIGRALQPLGEALQGGASAPARRQAWRLGHVTELM